MELGFTQEQEMFVVRRHGERCTRSTPGLRDNDRFPSELYAKMAAQGWIDFLSRGLRRRAWGRSPRSSSRRGLRLVRRRSSYSPRSCWAAKHPPYGTEAQKANYPNLVSGEETAFALSEPNVGSDAASVELFAAEEGDHFVLNGQKMFTTCAHVADHIVTVTRTIRQPERKHHGITIFLVDARSPGIEIRPLKQLGRTATHTNEVFYRDVRVPRERMMGTLHEGWTGLNQGLGVERMSVAMMYAGTAQAIVDYAVRYADRRQFGQPSKFQAVQHKPADMQMKADIARLLGWRVA
jgi:alkylation response protein AidB-like acyl-CoA dehydrogenase